MANQSSQHPFDFDYMYIRVLLPKEILSETFDPSLLGFYFLPRRSQNGFVSATGMVRASFPYITREELAAEQAYLKSQPWTSDEKFGNLWIPPEEALALAEEYKILPWICALLDPCDTHNEWRRSDIAAPPKFTSFQSTLASLSPNYCNASHYGETVQYHPAWHRYASDFLLQIQATLCSSCLSAVTKASRSDDSDDSGGIDSGDMAIRLLFASARNCDLCRLMVDELQFTREHGSHFYSISTDHCEGTIRVSLTRDYGGDLFEVDSITFDLFQRSEQPGSGSEERILWGCGRSPQSPSVPLSVPANYPASQSHIQLLAKPWMNQCREHDVCTKARVDLPLPKGIFDISKLPKVYLHEPQLTEIAPYAALICHISVPTMGNYSQISPLPYPQPPSDTGPRVSGSQKAGVGASTLKGGGYNCQCEPSLYSAQNKLNSRTQWNSVLLA